ncbi:hypothetical protein HPB47_016249 [Ixodes persulcatus]|uniref:Uncharacterized protein n=1 Tax=Ixodes persulcatus TaxID=34615 RepID=A0AC60QRH0_IXOPE|nr:hypothetical protein HPB47_016249 [Ixodes persulcatus]
MQWFSVSFPPPQSRVPFLFSVSKGPSAPLFLSTKPAASHQSRRLPRLQSSKRPTGSLSRRVLNLPELLSSSSATVSAESLNSVGPQVATPSEPSVAHDLAEDPESSSEATQESTPTSVISKTSPRAESIAIELIVIIPGGSGHISP